MTDYISRQAENEKTYKLNSGETLVFNYNDNGLGLITVECMDAIIDLLNNSVDVVRCKDCRYWNKKVDMTYCEKKTWLGTDADDFCSFGERADK